MTSNNTAPKRHPYDFLDDSGRLGEEHLALLELNASSRVNHEDIELTIFRFDGKEFNFVDKEVWVNHATRNWTIPASPDCTCHEYRSPLQCHCSTLPCPDCGMKLGAWNVACEFELTCLDNGCPHCRHYRTACGRDRILQTIRDGYNETLAAGSAQDEAALSGISAIHGDVDAARFEITDQFLDDIATRGGTESAPTWTMPDSSVIHSTRNGLWYRYAEAADA